MVYILQAFHVAKVISVWIIGKVNTPYEALAMASLVLVLPGAATDGVTPIFLFFLKKTDDLSRCHLQSGDLF